jgi:hypothetical protein
MGSSLEEVRAAKPHAARKFKKLGALVGVGISRQGNGYGLKINLSRPPRRGQAVPTEIKGVPIEISIVGTIRKRPLADA